jgi:hypothetical protein
MLIRNLITNVYLMTNAEYLVLRFIRNNHPKYHKYCKEWIDNLTTQQIIYFEKEKQNLNL